jgi:hypothetical protein
VPISQAPCITSLEDVFRLNNPSQCYILVNSQAVFLSLFIQGQFRSLSLVLKQSKIRYTKRSFNKDFTAISTLTEYLIDEQQNLLLMGGSFAVFWSTLCLDIRSKPGTR